MSIFGRDKSSAFDPEREGAELQPVSPSSARGGLMSVAEREARRKGIRFYPGIEAPPVYPQSVIDILNAHEQITKEAEAQNQ